MSIRTSLLRTKALAAALVLAGTFGATSPAWAVLVDCAGSLGHVDSSTACQYLDPPDNSNVANVTNVNAAGFFGFSDWSGVDGWLQTDGGAGSSGSWDIGSLTAGLTYMITFKDGADTNLISFIITAAAGNWTTPFTEPPFDFSGGSVVHNVSHFSIFSRGTPTDVPEPATLLMLSLGLLSLGFARRKKA
jgi:PEP-CTERM motif-containing protein